MRVEELIGVSRGILFDFNGTLSNDEGLLEQAYDSALLQLGLTRLDPGEYAALLGRSDPDIAQAVLERRGEGARINESIPTAIEPNHRPAPRDLRRYLRFRCFREVAT